MKPIRGTTHRGDTVTILARIVTVDRVPIVPANITTVEYSIAAIDDRDPDARTPVDDHDGVALTPADVLFDALQTGDAWTEDEEGYNFRHTIDTAEGAAFPTAGVTYLVRYELTPVSGPVIVIEARVLIV